METETRFSWWSVAWNTLTIQNGIYYCWKSKQLGQWATLRLLLIEYFLWLKCCNLFGFVFQILTNVRYQLLSDCVNSSVSICRALTCAVVHLVTDWLIMLTARVRAHQQIKVWIHTSNDIIDWFLATVLFSAFAIFLNRKIVLVQSKLYYHILVWLRSIWRRLPTGLTATLARLCC